MPMMTYPQFLAQIEGYLTESKTKPSRFGQDCLGDPNFVFELRNGRKPNLDVISKVLAHMDARQAACAEKQGAAA